MATEAESKGDAGNGTAAGAETRPSINLPKGGGAIRGMGEKFAANPVTGTGSMSIPVATSPGRSGFGPQLSLSYDSGAGNGPFGLGWSLSLPQISRKTDKGLPRYDDADGSDVFILSGAEDLVPVLRSNALGDLEIDEDSRTVDAATYHVRRFRPRIEGLFARIERWIHATTGETHWRSISKDNIVTFYGKTSESRIADPADPSRIFTWLICQSHDDKGNALLYRYVPETSDGIALNTAHEANRTATSRSANRYLKHIHYGNTVSLLASGQPISPLGPDLSQSTWLFEVLFDYGEGHYESLTTPPDDPQFVRARLPAPAATWPVRADPFSSCRAGFEVRTYRLCRRVLMFHHFATELGTPDYLVRSTEFAYRELPIASFIASVTQSGYLRQPLPGQPDRYLKKSLPPLEFQYSEATTDPTVREVAPESMENLPVGLDGAAYQWVDLDGDGIPGVLTEQGHGWFYKRNLSPINTVVTDGTPHVEASFATVEQVTVRPSLSLAGHAQFMDLAGDGHPDFVTFEGPCPGFYERTGRVGWKPFRAFRSIPNFDTHDPNLKFVDLDGDGHTDVLISEDEVFRWYPSLGEDGFGPSEYVRKSFDEEKGAAIVFADATQSIFLADMSGDGLTDIVRIRNGEICYWPNLGYGRFGAKVSMDDAPWFDTLDLFDQRRIRLADIDGSGDNDLIYLHKDGVRIYFNQAGNSWSPAHILETFPRIDDLTSVQTLDLLGNGTACLVWSSPLGGDARRPMRYIDLMGGQKPHLLIKTINNLGAETVVSYAPSTKFYLQDEVAGKPWITRLPFPVHVVERTETHDLISRNRFVARYAYHHGFYDGVEREFRGFGLVEQFDTEELAALTDSADFPDAVNIDAASYVPTVLTKTWFHTGACLERGRISRHFEGEYYREGDQSEGAAGLTKEQLEAMLLPDTVLPTTLKRQDGSTIPWQLSDDEFQEACRALKGSVLRREIYALDGSDAEDRPYSATEQNYTVELLQQKQRNQHAVFFAHARESIDFHYERRLVDVAGEKRADPRVQHTMTLEVDAYGNVLESVAIGYGRRPGLSPLLGDDKLRQEKVFITSTESDVTDPIDEADSYRTPLPFEARTYELLKTLPDASLPDVTNLFGFEELIAKLGQAGDGSHDLPYEDLSASGATQNHPYRRLIEHVQTYYRKDDLSGPTPPGKLGSLGLLFESRKLALTPGLVTAVYGARVDDGMLESEGRYVHSGDVNWWIPSGRVFFDVNADESNPANTAPQELAEARTHFFMPRKSVDPFDQSATVDYDAHDLAMVRTRDALGNQVAAENDYRVLQAHLVTDPNGNRSEVAFDALGMVAGTAIMGKTTETLGDLLDAAFEPDLTLAQIDAFMAAPREPSPNPHESVATPIVLDLLGNATSRIVYDLDRFRRLGEAPFAATIARETHVSELEPGQQTKIQIGFSYSDGFGREIQKKVQAEPGPVVDNGPSVSPRWVASGWTIFNNKGKPVRQYEPFFDDTHGFRFGNQIGVSPVLIYDPVERVVATLHPDHTWEKVVFDPWQQETWNVSDTLLVTDPKDDPDAGGFFRRLPDGDYLPTWYAAREGGALGVDEQRAARKSAVHAATPAVAHADSLGRTFLTVAHNKLKYSNTPPAAPPVEEFYRTRVVTDIEGNQREVVDANDRIVMRYDYDMLGVRIHQASMEAGQRWMLNDVAGKPIYAWDSRNHRFHTGYDPLRRPTDVFLRQGNGPELLIGRTVYGETQANPEAKNQRGKPVQVFDQAGLVTSDDYDFKGNLRRSARTVANDYKKIYDWNSDAVDPTWERFGSGTTFDALNRPVTATAPDGSIYRPTFNEANLLEAVHVQLQGEVVATPFVTSVDYDAKGRRVSIAYGNNVTTEYAYDLVTLRLTHLSTTRGSDGAVLQDLSYVYDPAGNITRIQDDAQQTIYFKNTIVEPSADYTYDAVSRLIEATGREHLGQVGGDPVPHSYNDVPRVGLLHPGDGNAMGRYLERYLYDGVGNFRQMQHRGSDPAHPGWTRSYAYDEASLIEPAKQSNRLSSTTVGGANPFTEHYDYDLHGNMLDMPHLQAMQWDFKDQLHMTRRQAVNASDEDGVQHQRERTYYVYDAAGQRARKVTEGQNELPRRERIYLGDVEVYREFTVDGTDVVVERQTVHVVDGTQRVAMVDTRTRGHDESAERLDRYQLGTHLGSATLELNRDGRIISYEEYAPYGETSYQALSGDIKATSKRYRYTGMERDEEHGLNYHKARYYAPWVGRWVSCDPIGAQGGLNLYRYCGGDPINSTDRMGSDEWSWNPLNFFSDDYTFNPGEYTAKVARGFVMTAIHTAKDTATRVVDLGTQGTAAAVKFVSRGHIELPYTEWSPEAKRYDEDLSWSDNVRKSGHETKEGFKAFARGLASKDPDSVGTLVFVVATSVGGKPPTLPNIPFLPVPRFATAVGTTAARTMLWEGTSISTSAMAKFGAPMLAVTATSSSSEGGGSGSDGSPSGDPRPVDPSGEPFKDPVPPKYKSGYPSKPVIDHRVNRARGGPDNSTNTAPATTEANARKGGFEGNYTRDILRYEDQGLHQIDGHYVLVREDAYILNDVHARPVDPFALDELPNQEQVCRPDDAPFRSWSEITPFWRR